MEAPEFLIVMASIVGATFIFARFLRLFERRGSQDTASANGGEARQLLHENAQLTDKVARLEKRMAVMERIATDKAARLSSEIDELA